MSEKNITNGIARSDAAQAYEHITSGHTTQQEDLSVTREISFCVGNDGVLFDIGCKTLLYYPPQNSDETYAVPEGVHTIAENAFKDNPHLKTVILPTSLEVICESAFESCESLQEVSFSSDVEQIGKRAFYGCRALDSIGLPDTLKSVDEFAHRISAATDKEFDAPARISDNAYAVAAREGSDEFTDGSYMPSDELTNRIKSFLKPRS